jgi:hypothetical protein
MTAIALSILDIDEIRRQAVKWADLSDKTVERITLHLDDRSDGRTKKDDPHCHQRFDFKPVLPTMEPCHCHRSNKSSHLIPILGYPVHLIFYYCL